MNSQSAEVFCSKCGRQLATHRHRDGQNGQQRHYVGPCPNCQGEGVHQLDIREEVRCSDCGGVVHLVPGDVLVIEVRGTVTNDQAAALAYALHKVTSAGVTVLLQHEGWNIEKADEDFMQMCGWVRDPKWVRPDNERPM